MTSYAPLWVKTNFSFLEGASHPEELVERAHEFGLPALAITDRDGVHGLVRAHVRARELGLTLLLGAQVTVGAPADPGAADNLLLQPDVDHDPPAPLASDDDRELVLLAETRAGYGRLCQLLSRGRLRSPKGQSRVSLGDVMATTRAPGLITLCRDPELLAALASSQREREPANRPPALYALCARHQAARERSRERQLRAAAARLGVPVVAGVEVLYHDAARRPLQDVLSCIRRGRTLSAAGDAIRGNAEHDLKSPAAMRTLFADDPEALARTLEIAARCEFTLDQLRYRYPASDLPEDAGGDASVSAGRLRALTLEGARVRYGGDIPGDVMAQLEREFALIRELDYGGYFLTMWEIVQFCRREGILCQGRGSAANSAVCYCLGITAIDPVRMDLLFERFISRERAEPPDIDLDIEHQRREEVIQFVYRRYGRRHAAMVSTVIRYRPRSAIREVGKVLEIPAAALDRAARLHDGYGGELRPDALAEAGLLDPEGRDQKQHGGSDSRARVEHFLRLTAELLGFPRHTATHPGGFLIGAEPVDTLVPIEPAAMPGRTVIQWDKNDVEDLGLFKVDLLGLGALTHVHGCLELIREHEGVALEMATIPAEDPETYAMCRRADTVGVFQIESRAQMAMLPRLKPRTFYDLVVEIALVRPGPIQGEMVHPYLRRRAGQERVEYPHPSLERVLGKTLGVPLFQEQVMRLAILTAGYTPGEADRLRRDMTAWQSQDKIEAHRERLCREMIRSGIEPEFAERVFSQIKGFGEYGFPESHAASFALIAYVTAWLRRHHLAAFTCSLLNAQPMGFYSVSTIVEDARRHQLEIRPVCARRSAWDCTLERVDPKDPTSSRSPGGLALRMGLRFIKGLGARERDALEASPGPHATLEDFVRAVRLGPAALQLLAEAGAFTRYGYPRRDAIWALRGLASTIQDRLQLPGERAAAQPLFAKLGEPEAIIWDYRRTGHSTRGHPMKLLRPALRALGLPDARRVNALRDKQRADFVGMVICRQQPQTANTVVFYTLEDETGFVNLVVWGRVFARHAVIGRALGLLGVSGRMQVCKDGIRHLVADALWDPREQTPELTIRARAMLEARPRRRGR